MLAMILKEFRQVTRDRRTLAMLIVMPVILLLVFGYAASFDVDEIPTMVVGPQAEFAADQLPEIFVVDEIDPDGTEDDAVNALVAADVNVAFVADAGAPTALIDGSQLFMAQTAVQVTNSMMTQVPDLSQQILFNPDLDTSAVLVPGTGPPLSQAV